MIALYTLDSHDYFGPFVNERAAHNYAKDHKLTSYTLIKLLDSGTAMDYHGTSDDLAMPRT
jgi:hypothetical protein